jgi:predicted nuclease of predicted toxin-antitoxin system
MRVLIDECIDERLRNHLPGQDCQTVRYAGLGGLKNGDLLTAAESAEFDAFLTLDQGIEYQQNLIDRKIASPFIPACLTALESIQAGQLVEIESNGR